MHADALHNCEDGAGRISGLALQARGLLRLLERLFSKQLPGRNYQLGLRGGPTRAGCCYRLNLLFTAIQPPTLPHDLKTRMVRAEECLSSPLRLPCTWTLCTTCTARRTVRKSTSYAANYRSIRSIAGLPRSLARQHLAENRPLEHRDK